MPKKDKTTLTRSISFDTEVFDLMEKERTRLRLDRSQYIRQILERELGLVEDPAGDGNPAKKAAKRKS